MIKDEFQLSTQTKDQEQFDFMISSSISNNQSPLEIKFTEQEILGQKLPKPDKQQHQEHHAQNLMLEQSSFYQLASPTKFRRSPPIQHSEMLNSIRDSYAVLKEPVQQNSPSKRRAAKMSFIVTVKQNKQDRSNMEQLVEILKAPLEIQKKKSIKKHKFQEICQDLYFLKNKKWEKPQISINHSLQELVIDNLHIPFKKMIKLKIYPPNQKQKINVIKMTFEQEKGNPGNQQQIFFNSTTDKQIRKVPHQFLFFVEILVQKLKFQKRYKQTSWEKKQHACLETIYGSYIFGEIYKKSQNLEKWIKRYVVVNNKGIFSYRSSEKKQKYSFHIERSSIHYIWTRFNEVDNCLVIKIKHGIKKTQFAIPIVNFSYPNHKNWLFYFFRILMLK